MIDTDDLSLRRADYRPPAFWIDTVDLDFDLREKETIVRATLTGYRNKDENPANRPLVLQGEQLKTRRVASHGVELDPLSYVETDHTLTLVNAPDRFTISTAVALYPQDNTSLVGLYRSGSNYYTDLEPMGFRRLTWFLDRPDVMARFRTRIEADRSSCPVLLSNGNLVEQGEAADGRHWVRWEDPIPKPSYLFALVAGDLRRHSGVFTTMSGREVQLEIWVDPENVHKCTHTLESLKRAMRWDEERFGREYDLDIYMIVAVNDFNGGAMENKGLNIFNSKYVLADPDTTTDDDFESIESCVAHEYFHNWTGNRVTLQDWFQLTLKEGLTVYRDQEFSAEMTSGPVKRIESVQNLRERQFPEDDGAMSHPVRPDEVIAIENFYTATVYDKGAEVIRMCAELLGRDGFRRGMDLYFDRHDGQAVTCDDFLGAMQGANNVNLEQFTRWYAQSGTPIVSVAGELDEATHIYTLNVRQELPAVKEDPGPLLIPIRMALFNENGAAVPLRCDGESFLAQTDRVLWLREREQSFSFTEIDGPVVPSLFRGFSAPVRCVIERSRAELRFLAAHETDPVSRWDAGQELALSVIVELTGGERPGELDSTLTASLGEVLNDASLDMSLRALMLNLPGERVVAQRLDPVDPEAIHQARRLVEKEVGRALRARFEDTYMELNDGAPYANDRMSIGRRRLKNVALGYLCSAGDEETPALAKRQFDGADNMTDALAALRCLVDIEDPLRAVAMDAFYQRWRDQPLVLDKWFAIQAKSNAPNTFEQVVELSKHRDFTVTNPNRLFSLLSTFAHQNPAHFHRVDGAAYEFIADRVIEVDAINPVTAARLASAFLTWRRLEPRRRAALEAVLRRLEATELSTNTDEIVRRALAPPQTAETEARRTG